MGRGIRILQGKGVDCLKALSWERTWLLRGTENYSAWLGHRVVGREGTSKVSWDKTRWLLKFFFDCILKAMKSH